MSLDPGSSVLVRAMVSADGACVMLAPGVEVCARSVDIVTDVPQFDGEEQPLILLFFCGSEAERQELAERFGDLPGVEPRAI